MNTFSSYLTFEAVGMRSIPHIDQMKPADLFELLDSEDWEITEKVDGSNVSFGLNENHQIYTKSKRGYPVTSPADYERMAASMNNDVMLGFAELLKMLQNNEAIVVKFFDDLKAKTDMNIQIFGEIFSRSQMNVIAYSSELIGNGTIVVFGVVEDTGSRAGSDLSQTSEGKQIMQRCVQTLNELNGWKFYYKRPVSLTICKSYRNTIKQFIDQYGPALKSRKRDSTSKRLKQEAKNEFVRIATEFKQQLLSQIKDVPSFLGAPEIEGVIIRNMKNGAIAKLVDIEGFGVRRAEAWAGVDALKSARKNLYKEVLKIVLKNADIFLLPAKQQEKLSSALEETGRPFANMEEILKVMYGDASEEVQFDKAEEMVNQMKQILLKHLQEVKDSIKLVKQDDAKAIQDTRNAIAAETQRISEFMHTIDRVVQQGNNPYLDVIKFILGPKALEELTQEYLK